MCSTKEKYYNLSFKSVHMGLTHTKTPKKKRKKEEKTTHSGKEKQERKRKKKLKIYNPLLPILGITVTCFKCY